MNRIRRIYAGKFPPNSQLGWSLSLTCAYLYKSVACRVSKSRHSTSVYMNVCMLEFIWKNSETLVCLVKCRNRIKIIWQELARQTEKTTLVLDGIECMHTADGVSGATVCAQRIYTILHWYNTATKATVFYRTVFSFCKGSAHTLSHTRRLKKRSQTILKKVISLFFSVGPTI